MANNNIGDNVQEQELLTTSPVKINNLTEMSKEIFISNRKVGWWSEEDLNALARQSIAMKYSKEGSQLIASKLCLIHSEVSEALEGMRKGLMDDHLKDEEQLGVELADVVIRVLDLAGACKINIGHLVARKYAYNQERADHKMENRLANGGKTI